MFSLKEKLLITFSIFTFVGFVILAITGVITGNIILLCIIMGVPAIADIGLIIFLIYTIWKD